MLNRLQLLVLAGLLSLSAMPILAEEQRSSSKQRLEAHVFAKASGVMETIRPGIVRGTAIDLLAQGVAQVTGVEVIQTDDGMELILKTVAGSERLVPLILSEEKDMVIDILDATLANSMSNGITELNPAPGITKITVNKVESNSIQVRITGENQAPSAEVMPGRDDLVLSIAPEGTTNEAEPDEEIEIIATGEAEEDGYNPKDSSTAIGTDTPIKDTPLSIEVVPQEVIEDRNVRELGEALETVPGVIEAGGRGGSVFGPNFKIRGFDVGDGLFRDGIPTNTLAPLSINDLERIEVLKGPASILFGQGEPGGIINLVTKKPLETPLYSASFSAGNFDTYEAAIDLSGPLNESKTVKYRLNLSYENYESFRDFVNGERFLASPALTWDIGKNTTIDFYGQYVSDQETVDSGIPAQGDGIVDVPQERFLDEDFGEFEQDQFRVGYSFDHQFNDTLSVRHALEYSEYEPSRFGVFFGEFDETTGDLTRFEYGTDEKFERFFTNVDAIAEFNTGSIEHQVLFGVEYLSNVDRQAFEFSDLFPSINVFNPVYSNNPFVIEPNFFRDDNVDSVGVYLQNQVDLLSNLIVLAGVRFDYVDQFRTVQDLGEEREEFGQDDTDFTPRVGIVYKPIEPVSVYASFTTSYNPTFGSSRNGDGLSFDPETGRQFEVGVKTEISEQLSFTFAAFDIRKQSVQTDDPSDPTLSVQTGEQASRGIELDVNGEILPGWNITAAYTFLDAFVSEDNTDVVDNDLPNVPESQFSLWTTYNLQRGSLEGLGVGLGFFALSDRFGDLDNSFTLPGYFRTDAALFYKRDNWLAQLNIENLFDVEYFASTNFDSRLGVNPGDPFTILGKVAVDF
ncbi:MAG: TonB-dependent siderophore receptor [Cyanobacteria bacterium J06642_3]